MKSGGVALMYASALSVLNFGMTVMSVLVQRADQQFAERDIADASHDQDGVSHLGAPPSESAA